MAYFDLLQSAGTLDFARNEGDPYGIRTGIQTFILYGLAGFGGILVAVRFCKLRKNAK